MSDIDWNVMLRRIEREYDGLPPEPTSAEARARREAALRAQVDQRVALVGAWARMALVIALAVSLLWWPRASDCGVDLAAFVAAEAMVVVGGLWVAGYTWRHRLAATHGVAMVLFITGLVLVSVQLLPRAGYATIAGVHATSGGWRCGRH